MVKVTFDYGNKEDHKLILEMIGEPDAISGLPCVSPETKKLQKDYIKEAARACGEKDNEAISEALREASPQPVVAASERPAPGGEVVPSPAKTITAAEALPKVAAYCQDNGLEKPQDYFARVGKANIHDLTPEQIVELLTELGIEV
jgi:hypothetical protein